MILVTVVKVALPVIASGSDVTGGAVHVGVFAAWLFHELLEILELGPEIKLLIHYFLEE